MGRGRLSTACCFPTVGDHRTGRRSFAPGVPRIIVTGRGSLFAGGHDNVFGRDGIEGLDRLDLVGGDLESPRTWRVAGAGNAHDEGELEVDDLDGVMVW